MSFSPASFGPVLQELLEVDRCRPLDEGSPNAADRERLQSLTVDAAFAHAQVVDVDQARCCLSGVWLLYDFLDESHTISQGISTSEGSFWHGIMHRREGDFSNAKYWFRKVGDHPVYEQLTADDGIDDPILDAGEWDPYAFVDACQAAAGVGSEQAERCRRWQQREWEVLFEHCYRGAVGE